MLFGCSKVKGSSLVYPILTSFSCRYSKSYDISISLLKKSFIKHFSKSPREGGTHFQEKSMWSIKHDHFHSFGSTLRVLRTIAVPRQYPPSTPSGTFLHFSKNTFVKPKLDIGLGNSQFNCP
jgi:hypothetical protein